MEQAQQLASATIASQFATWRTRQALVPEFQLSVLRLAEFLSDSSSWLSNLEARGNADAADYRAIKAPFVETLQQLIQTFDTAALGLGASELALHQSYAQRVLHPYLLRAPVLRRAYEKPLGYPGDYAVVNLILGDPDTGADWFSRMVNACSVSLVPALAHQNRIRWLVSQLSHERARAAQTQRFAVMSVGCGPAVELQRWLEQAGPNAECYIELVDFDLEPLQHAFNRLQRDQATNVDVVLRHRSIQQLLREARHTVRAGADSTGFDVVYCAGLFDYLSDVACRRITRALYDWLRPGGLLLTTNVHPGCSSRRFMELLLEWPLNHRDEAQMLALAPGLAAPVVTTDATGGNVLSAIRKP